MVILETSLFDTIGGLPMHPMLVHFAVVLLPVSALGLIVLVLRRRWADRFGWLMLAGLAAGTGAAFVAKESGQALAERVGTPGTHAQLGDYLPWVALALALLALGWWISHRRDADKPTTGPITRSLAALSAVVAVVVTGLTVVVGHSGAEAVWASRVDPQPTGSATSEPSTQASTTAPEPTTSSAAPSASPALTMAEVAKHADASSCWTAINGFAFDLTDWIARHPGGQRVILSICGKDGTAAFRGQHRGQATPESVLRGYLIGKLN